MRLWEMTAEYRKLMELAEEDSLADPETDKMFQDTLEGMQGEISEKVDGCIGVMKTLEHEAEAIRQEEVRMAIRRRHLENRAARVKDYVIDCMTKTNTKTCESSLFRVTCSLGPTSVNVLDESKIPGGYFRVKRELSKSDVKDALAAGTMVPGAELIRKPQLRIS